MDDEFKIVHPDPSRFHRLVAIVYPKGRGDFTPEARAWTKKELLEFHILYRDWARIYALHNNRAEIEKLKRLRQRCVRKHELLCRQVKKQNTLTASTARRRSTVTDTATSAASPLQTPPVLW